MKDTHTREDAPTGYMFLRKGTKREFASTVFLGNGITIDDYELVRDEEYIRIMSEEESGVIPNA